MNNMPYKSVKSQNSDYGANLITYKGETVEISYNRAKNRLNYVECSCGRVVQSQSWRYHIKTIICQEWHYMHQDKLLSYVVRDDIRESYKQQNKNN